MNKYTCTICGAGCYSADTSKTICAECEQRRKDAFSPTRYKVPESVHKLCGDRYKDVVKVVRCKDCVHYEQESCAMYDDGDDGFGAGYNYSTDNGMDYCSQGERKLE